MIFELREIDGTSLTARPKHLGYVESSEKELIETGFEVCDFVGGYSMDRGWSTIAAKEVKIKPMKELLK